MYWDEEEEADINFLWAHKGVPPEKKLEEEEGGREGEWERSEEVKVREEGRRDREVVLAIAVEFIGLEKSSKLTVLMLQEDEEEEREEAFDFAHFVVTILLVPIPGNWGK